MDSTKKTADMGDGGVKNSGKSPTSFMDGPISNDLDPIPWSLSKKKTKAKKVYEERRQVRHFSSYYIIDVLWCQPIKLIQVISTSEFHEY